MHIDSVEGKMVVVGDIYSLSRTLRGVVSTPLIRGVLSSWFIAAAIAESNLQICTNPSCGRMGTISSDMLRIPVKSQAVADFRLPGMIRIRVISCAGCFHIIVRVPRTATTPPQVWNDAAWTTGLPEVTA
jgi:hypothetical protein